MYFLYFNPRPTAQNVTNSAQQASLRRSASSKRLYLHRVEPILIPTRKCSNYDTWNHQMIILDCDLALDLLRES